MNKLPSQTTDSRGNTSHVVMVVEDEYLIRSMIAEELRDSGFHVIECCTADEAVDILNADIDVDIVFSDIRMPGSLDGAALADVVTKQFPHLTMVLTSSESPVNGAAALQFVPKPYQPDRVIKLLNDLLRGTPEGPHR